MKKSVSKYLASETNLVDLYNYSNSEEEKVLEVNNTVKRGTKIETKGDSIVDNEVNYTLITLEDKEYYVVSSNLVDKEENVVLEKEKFVRTSVTVYKNETDSKIESFVKKGNKLEVIGYDKLLEDGNVNMYKIKKDDITGWVYAKYLVNDLASAEAVYNENGVYDIHKDRKYSSRELYGGKASTLDYYPYEKVEFSDNPLLKNAKSMYLNAGANVISNIDSYLKIAKSSGVNAIVVDIKDGALAYSSSVAKEYSPTAYKTAINNNDTYKSAIQKIKDAGIYAIGRIVVFNDVHYGKDHPEDCISSSASSRLWPSAYSRGAWEYNVELAKEAVREMGFNEIQFDYVRFPEDAYNMSVKGNTDFNNTYPILSSGLEGKRSEEKNKIENLLESNLQLDTLSRNRPKDKQVIAEILELLVDTLCSRRSTIRIASDDKPAEDVRDKLLSLRIDHIEYVLDCMAQNTTKVKNMKQYLLAALYNAPMTIDSYYSSLAQHDIAAGIV